MLGRSTRKAGPEDHEGQRLLNNDSQEDLHESSNGVLFAVQDDDDDDGLESSALDGPSSAHVRTPGTGHVRFQDEVQVIAPPLRSTTSSREAGE